MDLEIKKQNEDINEIINANDIKKGNINSEDLGGSSIFQFKNLYDDCENRIKIIYENKENINKIRIFGEEFVEKNKNKCKILFKNKIYDLQSEFYCKKNSQLEIELIGIINITNMSHIFNSCSSLLLLPDISKWNTDKIIDMSHLFYYCSSLKSLPDLSRWKTNNVTNMSNMFNRFS